MHISAVADSLNDNLCLLLTSAACSAEAFELHQARPGACDGIRENHLQW